MQDAADAPKPAHVVRMLPREAYLELCQIRDHMRLMAQLVEGRARTGSLQDIDLQPGAWTWLIERISKDVERIVSQATPVDRKSVQ